MGAHRLLVYRRRAVGRASRHQAQCVKLRVDGGYHPADLAAAAAANEDGGAGGAGGAGGGGGAAAAAAAGAPARCATPELILDEVPSAAQPRPVLVTGEAASGKSTFARLFIVTCLQQFSELQLVPYLLTTIDLMRIIKQNCSAATTSTATRPVYGPRARYLFLKQAMLERRLVLFLDGMTRRLPASSGLRGVHQTACRMTARIA